MAKTKTIASILSTFQISGKLETSPEQQRCVSWRRLYIFPIAIYRCETELSERQTGEQHQPLSEMGCWRKLLGISYRHHITNEHIQSLIGKQPSLTTNIHQHKQKYFEYVCRMSGDSLEKKINNQVIFEATRGKGRP